MQLSKRLETCLEYTNGFVKLADIGTDHAMLPIAAVLRGYVYRALAIDNKYGPFLQARTNVRKYRVSDKVSVLLGEGLSKIDDETDVVVISGMGGEMIVKILQNGEHKNIKRFILQPNTNIPVVREALAELSYHIVDELVFKDGNKYYEVIVIERGKASLTPVEVEFGPLNCIQKPYYFVEKWTKEKNALTAIVNQINDDEERQKVEKRITLIEEVLDERK
ncbi:tRNA (adenine(22)-N(1))-methyltransferase [Candidatus Xianfuyuplasma coldseepsis]|uniref:SAM-dependent methyltransferase n=1 Tax=Candidatus Xianfuyuplasma coldseepsis TaxID=2782163 RepID=A0A7L7KV89_9MOLU|nr:tRNA (adenine(22)-N(1))-methyltransferase TrmK [Xianfuyuplasma coldseepsis]QMS85904.1 SAM-dependent methyltransferase [Xianfuyuplasma coldseepsis]